MATSGSSLAIATGIYAIILAACILFFSIWRRRQLTKKFYAPKRYLTADGHQRPPKLSTTLGGWVPQVRRRRGKRRHRGRTGRGRRGRPWAGAC